MLLFSHTPTNAEVIFDGSIHNELNFLKMEGSIDIKSDYGQINGSNLYHSFRTFNINKNETATFSGPNSIENIITRVTGAHTSLIDGILQSSIPDANFYLLNPSGVIFGKNASLKIGGSFHVSTADYIKMNNNDIFYVDTQKSKILSSAKPSAFGFIDDVIADISILENQDSLQVNTGKTISLIAGNIIMNNGSIKAEEGRINIASIRSAGEIEFAEEGIQAIPDIKRGTISMTNNSEIDVSGAGSGNFFMIGGEFILDDSEIVAKSKGNKDGGVTHINVDNFYANNNGNLRSEVTSNENKGGSIIIQAKNYVCFQNVSKISTSPNGSFFNVKNCNAGNIDIAAKSILFNNQSSINSDSYNAGNSGNISLIASENITFSNFSTIFTSTTDHGNAGHIDIQANNIYFTDGSGPGSQTNGAGKGGNIHIIAKDSIVLHGIDGNEHGRNITSYSGDGDYGPAGDVDIKAHNLEATNFAGIIVGTKGSGDGGSLNLEVNHLKLDNSVISSQSTAANNGGAAGQIRIGNKIIFQDDHSFTIAEPCNKISLVNKAEISTDSVSSGGGIINIKSRQLYCLMSSCISTNVYDGSGKGGDININDVELVALNHSHISANAIEGDGGAIFIHAEHFLKSADSQITATSERGNDGSVTIEAPETDVEKGLGLMAADFLDSTQWMNNNCNIHSLEQISRFTIQGKKAIPEHFNDLVASPPFILKQFKDKIFQKKFDYASQLFDSGDYENAAETFEKLISTIDISTHMDQYCAVVMYLIPTFQALGIHDKCFIYVDLILPKLENKLSELNSILIYNLIGDLYLSMNDLKQSVKFLSVALKYARASKHPTVLSIVMNNSANALYIDGKDLQAIDVFRSALRANPTIDNDLNPLPIDLHLTIQMNLIFAMTQTRDITNTCIEYQNAEKQIQEMPNSYQKASKLFQLCLLAQEIKTDFQTPIRKKYLTCQVC
ncbi:MAG: filamentous hemagglutinin-like protein [Candidatus Magnetoglobus multicellularis str. Araruama]|uniref:Filamentous hemagglutinin-like protein n=1 Tax=Candidatus Magnetoglobus multicellularis str. Araruama TaxID=890399 RepID=A0A1V1P5S5_9BACT|nr:MAG: filamentous hemagglutinin-like protein [Candidatus Magnetoglobus multicellularis str. Araruama]